MNCKDEAQAQAQADVEAGEDVGAEQLHWTLMMINWMHLWTAHESVKCFLFNQIVFMFNNINFWFELINNLQDGIFEESRFRYKEESNN